MEDPFLKASQEYLQRRHEIALRLMAECDKQADASDASQENELRDQALLAIVKRDYTEAAKLTQQLATQHDQKQHVQQRRHQLRAECDRLCFARATLEQRQELLESAPVTIEDPIIGGVSGYLEKRHETALRLVAALDVELARLEAKGDDTARALGLRVKREQLSIEIDTLLKAMQVYEQREELLSTADEILGDGAPDTSAYLRRVLAYLDARSAIILKLIASIDEQLGGAAGTGGSGSSPQPSRTLKAEDQAHLGRQRAELVAELDQINEKISMQKRGEDQLRACGLSSDSCDPTAWPYIKVTTYLQNRSDVALQLIAFLDQRLESLNVQDEERKSLALRRDALRKEADAALAQIDQQDQGQALMDSLGVATKASRALPSSA
jgi:hypothetical protein